MATSSAPPGLPRPHKRPTQSRAVFTVQAIYDGFVRIWRRDGPDAATTRAIAAETGYAVGTIYDYFPNRTALLAGYYQHCIESMCQQIASENTANADQPWTARLHSLIRLTCGDTDAGPYFDRDMLVRESDIAHTRHQQRAFELCVTAWQAAIDSWADLDRAVPSAITQTPVMMVWGVMRYAYVLDRRTDQARLPVGQLCVMAQALIEHSPAHTAPIG